MRCHVAIAAVVLLSLALGAHAERLAYHTRPGQTAYRYEFTLSGEMQPPQGAPLPMAVRLQAQLIDQATGKVEKGLLPMTMTIKDLRINASSGQEEYSDVLDGGVLSFLRSPSGVMSNIRYVSKPQQSADLPMPALENAWLLFSRFGHHLRLPEKELRAGGKWTTDETLGVEKDAAITLKSENTLVGDKIVDGKRYVHIDSTFTLTAKRQPVPAEGRKSALASDFHMTGKSSLLFDPQAGEVFRSTVRAEIATKTSGGGSAKNAVQGSFTLRGTVLKVPPPAPAVKNGNRH